MGMVGELVEKGEEIKKYKFVVIKQSRRCKLQLGNIVNILITMYGSW